jgi:hypothetical protein
VPSPTRHCEWLHARLPYAGETDIADVKSTLPDTFSGLAQLSGKNVAALLAAGVRGLAYRAAVSAIRRNGRRRRASPAGTQGQAATLARPDSHLIAPTIARTPFSVETLDGIWHWIHRGSIRCSPDRSW